MFDKNKQINKVCDAVNCKKEGIYPAPKSRNQLNDYYFFCIDHVRDFNKSWNYFEGLDEQEFEKEIRKSTTWERPSWKFGTKKIDDNIKEIFNNFKKEYKGNKNKQNQINTKTDNAWQVLELSPNSSIKDVKKKYKALAKKWHPDTTLDFDNNKMYAKEKFVKVTNAYKKIIKNFENDKNY